MLARCAGDDKYYPDRRRAVRAAEATGPASTSPSTRCSRSPSSAGFSQEKFEACLHGPEASATAVNAVRDRGAKQFKVDSTPTFFINGKRSPGAMSIDEIRARSSSRCSEARQSSGAPLPLAARDGRARMKFTRLRLARLQVLRRADRVRDRAGPDRHRRAERLRQVEPGRGAALGDGRKLATRTCAPPAWTT